jgi:RNA polymerase sigma-70 factor (ECF subfamily)
MGKTNGSERTRAITYCLVPRDLADRLHEPLRRHFEDDPSVEVVVERRADERRAGEDRRAADAERPTDRRRVLGAAGRRVADRRATQVSAAAHPAAGLPRRLRAHADRLVFVERILPTSQQREDEDAARLVVRFQAGERDVFGQLYMQYFNSVYAYLRVLFRNDPHQAEDLTQQVFTNALAALDRYERRAQPFRAWLFVIVRNLAFDEFRRTNRSDVLDPAEMTRRHERSTHEDTNLEALSWISDRELLMLIERLPLPQRQVLVLRHMLGLTTAEIGAILGRTTVDVRMLDSRARRFLEQRLTALGRAPTTDDRRHQWRTRRRNLPVGRARRFVLIR